MALWDKMKKALVGEPPKPADREKPQTKAAEPKAEAADSAWQQPEQTQKKSSAASGASAGGPYKKVRIEHGPKGWGGPLVVEPKPGKDLIYSVTGGGIHPIAQRIADLSGGRPFDGFNSNAKFEEIAVAVIDCGGTARVGVYPMKNVPTVDIYPTSPSGPLMRFIKEEVFVSGVRSENITVVED